MLFLRTRSAAALSRALVVTGGLALAGCTWFSGCAQTPAAVPARPVEAGNAQPGDAAPTRIPVTIDTEKGPVVVQAEVAATPETRQRGLMFRKGLGDHEGMIFLFPDESPLTFWMHNTLIPLDMIFIRADHTILGVVGNATPETETPRHVPGASQFVLEVSGGFAAAQGIKAGQTVTFYAPLPSI